MNVVSARSCHGGWLALLAIVAALAPPVCAQELSSSAFPSPRLVVQTGHSKDVTALAFSSSAPLLASTDGQTVLLWNFVQGKQLRSFRPRLPSADRLAFSPDGRFLAVAGSRFDEGHILIEDLRTEKSFSWRAHDSRIEALVFAGPKGRLLSAGFDGIREWNGADGSQLLPLGGKGVMDIAASSDGRWLVSGHYEGQVALWDLAAGKLVWSQSAHKGPVRTVAFHPEGNSFASGGDDFSFHIWNLQGDRVVTRHSHADGVNSIVYSPDGSRLFTASSDWTIKVWVGEYAVGPIETLDQLAWTLAVSPDSRTLAISQVAHWPVDQPAILLRDLKGGGETRSLGATLTQVFSVAYRPDGAELAVGGSAARVELWDLVSGRPPLQLGHNDGSVLAVAYSPDGRFLASADYGSTIQILDRQIGSVVSITADCPVAALSFSANGKALASGGRAHSDKPEEECGLTIWKFAESGVSPQRLAELKGGYRSVSLSPDGRRLATSPWGGGSVEIWDVEKGEPIWARSLGFNQEVAFGPGGKTLATTSSQGLSLWEVTGERQIPGDTPRWTKPGFWDAVAFSPEGRWLAASEGAALRIFDLTGSEVREDQELEGHGDLVATIAFDSRGHRLASGSRDGTVRLWERRVQGKDLRWEGLCTLISFPPLYRFKPEGPWIVVDPTGHFDTNSPNEMPGLHWVMPEHNEAIPVESFLRDFYQPRLLTLLLRGTPPPVPRLGELLHETPKVKIKRVEQRDLYHVDVVVEVAGTLGTVVRDGKRVTESGGIYDLRLFVEGKLAQYRPESGASAEARKRCAHGNPLDERDLWRCSNRVTDGVTPVEILFENVRLPQPDLLGPVLLSAYAFNRDRVKSVTHHYQFDPDLNDFFDAEEMEPPRAYLITIGVSTHQEPGPGNLPMSAVDARWIRDEVARALNRPRPEFSTISEIVPVSLVSDRIRDPRSEALPTKENIRTVFDILAGREVPEVARNALPAAVRDRLRASTVDDLVLVAFTGHGRTDARGRFYLLPYDAGALQGEAHAPCARCISTDELAEWLRDVQARTFALILDSCEAAASVDTDDYRPGPMGDPGLGQLAYDKEMLILAAAQPRQEATAPARYGHGLLTYALVKEGLIDGNAFDSMGDLSLLDWLRFAARRVPELYASTGRPQAQVPALFDFTSKIPGQFADRHDDFNIVQSLQSSVSSVPVEEEEHEPEVPAIQPERVWKLDRQPGEAFLCMLHLSANGRTAAVACSDDARVWIFDTANGRKVVLPSALSETEFLGKAQFGYYKLALSPQGDLLAVPGHDRITLWDIWRAKSHTVRLKDVHGLEFADGGRLLVIKIGLGSTRIYDVTKRRRVRRFPLLGQPAVLSPDGRTLCAPAEKGSPRLWDLRTGRVRGLPGANRCLAFSPTGSSLAFTDVENWNSVRIWHVPDARTLGQSRLESTLTENLPLLFLHDGSGAVLRDDGGAIRLWDFARDKLSPPLQRDGTRMDLLAVSRSGAKIALVKRERGWIDVELHGRDEERPATVGILDSWSIQASPDGRTFAASLLDQRALRLWSLETGSLLGECRDAGRNFVFSTAGDLLVAMDSETLEVRLYRVPPEEILSSH